MKTPAGKEGAIKRPLTRWLSGRSRKGKSCSKKERDKAFLEEKSDHEGDASPEETRRGKSKNEG